MPSAQSSSRLIENRVERDVDASRRKKSTGSFGHHVLILLIGLRLVNALSLRTFFQPDEYYQALEPAWGLAFGDGSGPWITWVRKSVL